jgi:uncharacterized protein (DUF2384 family)
VDLVEALDQVDLVDQVEADQVEAARGIYRPSYLRRRAAVGLGSCRHSARLDQVAAAQVAAARVAVAALVLAWSSRARGAM